jgi:hypothetical protein
MKATITCKSIAAAKTMQRHIATTYYVGPVNRADRRVIVDYGQDATRAALTGLARRAEVQIDFAS